LNNIISSIYDNNNDIWGNPQKYKDINFYPLKLKEQQYKKIFYNLFCFPKNSIQDKDILKMSYLKFLIIILAGSNRPELIKDLTSFFQHITQENKIEILYGENKNIKDELSKITLKFIIGEVEFTESEFDNIREIILEQNGTSIDFIEQYNPELEEKLNTFNKTADTTEFKDEVFAFCSLLGKTITEIGEYTLFQYKIHIEKLLLLQEFQLYKPLEISGQITLKKGEIKHFLSSSKKSGRYDSILIGKESFKNTGDIFKAINN